MSLFRAMCVSWAARTRPPHVPLPPERLRPSQSPIHPRAGYAEGTEPGWMAGWEMWSNRLNPPKDARKDAA